MAHDFKKFPELATSQMQFYYWESPHKQITEDFFATVTNVHDGDTITVKTDFRSFEFPIRMAKINAPELSEADGKKSKSWLEKQILGEEVFIKVDPFNRVGKFGRLIGEVIFLGINLCEESLKLGFSKTFGEEVLL